MVDSNYLYVDRPTLDQLFDAIKDSPVCVDELIESAIKNNIEFDYTRENKKTDNE